MFIAQNVSLTVREKISGDLIGVVWLQKNMTAITCAKRRDIGGA
jgi:hypothetical protein